MNKELKVTLRHRSSEQGFAIPIAMGLGLVMILIGAMMIMRSQGDQVTASAQKSTAQSLSVAEIGITRVQDFLNKYRYFIKVPSTQWTDPGVIERAANDFIQAKRPKSGCSLTQTVVKSNIQDDVNSLLSSWQPVDSNDSSKGEIKVRSYIYNAPNGTLTVDARIPQGSYTALQVIIPATTVPSPPSIQPPTPPGLWLNISNLTKNQTVKGSLWLNG